MEREHIGYCKNCGNEDWDIQNGLCSTCGCDTDIGRLSPEKYQDYIRYCEGLYDIWGEEDEFSKKRL